MDIFSQFDPTLDSLWQTALKYERVRWPFLTIAWHKAWYQHFGNGECLHILGDPVTSVVIPLSIKEGIVHFSGGEEISDYLDCIGSDKNIADTWKQALHILKELHVTTLILRNIPENSSSLTFFKSLDAAVITREDTTPILALPQTYESYLEALGRKERHETRRKMRRFDERFPDVSFQVHETPDMELLIRLMRLNYEKQKFLTKDMENFFRELPAISNNALRQFTLTQGDNILATTVAFIVGQSILLYNSGFNPNFIGSGWYLKSKLIEWAISSQFTHINFLQGNERYKYDFGALDFPVYTVTMLF